MSKESSPRIKVGLIDGETFTPAGKTEKHSMGSITEPEFDYHTGKHKLWTMMQEASLVLNHFEHAFNLIEEMVTHVVSNVTIAEVNIGIYEKLLL